MNSYVFIHMLRIFMCYTSATIFVYILGQVDVRRARQQLKAFLDQQHLTQLLFYCFFFKFIIILSALPPTASIISQSPLSTVIFS